MTEPQEQLYELVFEGPLDTSPETIRRLKAAFIAELECSIEETVTALQKFPVTIKKAHNAEALTKHLTAIKNAGGKVLVIRPRIPSTPRDIAKEEAEISKHLELQELWAEDAQGNDRLVEVVPSDAVQAIEFEITDDGTMEAPPRESKPKTEVFELDENTDLEAVLKEVTGEDSMVIGNRAPEDKLKQPPQSQKVDPPQSPEPAHPTFDLQEETNEPPAPPAPKESEKEADLPALPFELDDSAASEPEPVPVSIIEKSAPPTADQVVSALTIDNDEAPPPNPPEVLPPSPPKNEPEDFGIVLDLSKDPEPVASVSQPPEPPKVALEPKTAINVPPISSISTPIQAKESSDVAPPAAESTEQEIPSVPKKRKKSFFKRKLPWDILAPILGGSIVLGVINFWYFGGFSNVSGISFEIPDVDEPADTSGMETLKPVSVPITIAGSVTSSGVEVIWKGAAIGSKLRGITVTLLPPPPRELTKEEIGTGVQREPLIHKIELSEIDITNLPDRSFKATAAALIAVEDNGRTTRFVGQAEMSGQVKTESKTIAATVIAWTIERPGAEQGFTFSRIAPGKYDLKLNVGFNN